MPRDARHTEKAERNEYFAAALDRSDITRESWAIIALFYSALHYVQAVLKAGGVDPRNHKARAAEIARDPILKYVSGQYDYLRSLSELARYEVTAAFPPKPYDEAKARLEAVKKQVDKVA